MREKQPNENEPTTTASPESTPSTENEPTTTASTETTPSTEIEPTDSASPESAVQAEPAALPELQALPELAALPQLSAPAGTAAAGQPDFQPVAQPVTGATPTGPVWQQPQTSVAPMGQPGWPAGGSMNQPPVDPQWAQWASPTPAPNPYSNPYQNPLANPYAHPYQQPPQKSSKTVWIVALVGLVVVALVVAGVFAFRGSRPKPGPTSSGASAPGASAPASPAPGPTSQNPSGPAATVQPPAANSIPDFLTMPKWSTPVEIGWPNGSYVRDVVSAGFGDVVIVTGTNSDQATDLRSTLVAAVDLASMKVLWSANFDQKYSGYDWVVVHIDPQGIVVETQGNNSTTLQVVDPQSGNVIASAELSKRERVVQVVSGFIVTDSITDYCIRSITAPQDCQQTITGGSYMSMNMDFQPAFGGGRWLNTGRGVYDLSTGKPASFGSDAAGYSFDKPEVRYVGDTPDRVFRVECSSDISTFVTTCTYQPWDTAKNKALGQAVPASLVTMTGDGAAFVATTQDAKGSFQVARYTWPDASVVWKGDVIQCADGYCRLEGATAEITGRTYLLFASGQLQTLLDAETGTVIKLDSTDMFRYPPTAAFGGQQVVYLGVSRDLLGFDGASGDFKKLWALQATAYMSIIKGAGSHVVGLEDSRCRLWVLEPA